MDAGFDQAFSVAFKGTDVDGVVIIQWREYGWDHTLHRLGSRGALGSGWTLCSGGHGLYLPVRCEISVRNP